MNRKFYVKRVPCWGGTFVYYVADRETRRIASTTSFKSERAAELLLERMEADWRRFEERDAKKPG